MNRKQGNSKGEAELLEASCHSQHLKTGAIFTDEGSKPEILSRMAQTTPALTKLKTIWKDRNIVLSPKIRPMRTLVISVFLNASQTESDNRSGEEDKGN
ncbi:endonuclease-reverse transcriptase [Plakobranchus ocellatus]|uniref:Endonuclease-reverse transcriptase n=1 Tax=Plakobranchus ocellatus TaxID=259542 RepID=A0AAV4BIM2_9GAST|nr:endonuclease-reverse transcriptase [Plakobranchus ocellatus]